ncbi:alpha/beta-hydrolase [Pleomassaria siparia CBS 279.74]|uniref:Alpha/beta-hydrolase n=1 Tax=Pleomassaria siparia CBS 279.74 TaxID=1314801 RepID=A0A6G1JTT8_9PLEO|nr:alpha/beta-hydrolase [Pleomassaria siparia CBS 279.74]
MPFGPLALTWRTPSPNPPNSSPLPCGITRSYISTPSGPLELLTALPPKDDFSNPPLFFAHGGFGCASVWLSYMQFFASCGYPCYAVSYRGHGNSWYPSLWRMYMTPMSTMGDDLVAGMRYVEEAETKRRGLEHGKKAEVVLIAHSEGGALGQDVLSRGLVHVKAFCMCATAPGFGFLSIYKFWSLSALIHFSYRLFHPRYMLANTAQVRSAFFTPSTPKPVVQALERLLSPYESMLWLMQTLFCVVIGGDVLSSITGWGSRKAIPASKTRGSKGIPGRLLVLAAERDVLCRPDILLGVAQRYCAAFSDLVREGKIEGVSEVDLRAEKEQGVVWDGVGFQVVKGLGHHLQNHEDWEAGADVIWRWLRRL